jgi:hypothetical protein
MKFKKKVQPQPKDFEDLMKLLGNSINSDIHLGLTIGHRVGVGNVMLTMVGFIESESVEQADKESVLRTIDLLNPEKNEYESPTDLAFKSYRIGKLDGEKLAAERITKTLKELGFIKRRRGQWYWVLGDLTQQRAYELEVNE